MTVQINSDRLWQSILDMAEIGATAKGGSARLALSDEDRQARDLFVDWCRALDCDVEVDALGNIFATRPGRAEVPPVMTGSHLDTQPTGGRFDGVYGVMAGLEVLRALDDAQLTTAHPLQVVCWTNEEGARFQPAMVGSGAVAGAFDLAEVYAATDAQGLRLEDELRRIGYLGERPVAPPRATAYLEAHIEQGPVLESAGEVIGVVTHQQGIRWYRVTVTGQECHAGTTPMPLRRDALMAAAELALTVRRIAEEHAPAGCGTVGVFDCLPGSPNTVPGQVHFSVDLRHPDNEVLQQMETQLRSAAESLGDRCQVEIDGYWQYPARPFDATCIDAVQHAVEALRYPHRRMITGAGHDASYMADVVPTSMIFIPCRDGISHNEVEYATPEHCAAGCEVLLHAMLTLAEGSGDA